MPLQVIQEALTNPYKSSEICQVGIEFPHYLKASLGLHDARLFPILGAGEG